VRRYGFYYKIPNAYEGKRKSPKAGGTEGKMLQATSEKKRGEILGIDDQLRLHKIDNKVEGKRIQKQVRSLNWGPRG